MTRYASETTVTVSQSRAEIERIVERYGATGYMSGWSAEKAVIAFTMEGRQVRFTLVMPPRDAPEFTSYKRGYTVVMRSPNAAAKLWEQACRQRWRALALVIKAKLESVESGIETVEQAFLANVVMADGQTVHERVSGPLALEYETGKPMGIAGLLEGPAG